MAYGPTCMLMTPSSMTAVVPVTSTRFDPTLTSGADPVAKMSVQVGSAIIQPSAVVRDLGRHLDSELSMKHHVAKVDAVYFYHLRRLRQIRRRVGTEVTIRLACRDI